MIASLSSKAITAKIRAKFGKRLKDKDYQNLLACKNVGEIATYLKSYTQYSKVMKNIDISDVHRRQLEIVLEGKILSDFESLMYYSEFDEDFLHVYTLKYISEYISKVVICISSGEPVGFVEISPSFNSISKLDIQALSTSKTFDDLLRVLQGTEFYPILKPIVGNNREFDYYEVDNALYFFTLSKIMSLVNRLKGKNKKHMQDLLLCLVDAENYVRVLRMKKRYNMSTEEMKKFIIPYGSVLQSKKVDDIMKLSSFSEVKRNLASTRIGKRLSKFECTYMDELKLKLKGYLGSKYVRFSTNASLTAMAYAFLSEIELMNIIHIVEGIRYGVSRGEIEHLLIRS